LIITSSGGGGLLQAAFAKEQKELDRDPSVLIIKKDLLKDWFGKLVGTFAIHQWDTAQRAGNVEKLRWLFEWQYVADIIFWPQVFLRALQTFFKEDIDHIIDTQPLATSAILSALRIFNFVRKKKLILEKVAVDLPTENNTHFFSPIKKLSKQNRAWLRLITIEPLLKESETEEEFWEKYCSLSVDAIRYEYVVRRSFFLWKDVEREKKPFSLSFEIRNSQEKELIARTLSKGSLKGEFEDKTVRFSIHSEAKVVTILLGSQVAAIATLNYIKGFIQRTRKNKDPLNLFVFCMEHRVGEVSLFSRVADLVDQEKDYPSHLSVIPFGIQSDSVIAPLFHRSDITCTRSGGQTAMELMCVMRGEIWIHSEAQVKKEKEPTFDELLKGIPGWEAGTAVYLCKKLGARIVTPELVGSSSLH
jgi:hypothetical protein